MLSVSNWFQFDCFCEWNKLASNWNSSIFGALSKNIFSEFLRRKLHLFDETEQIKRTRRNYLKSETVSPTCVTHTERIKKDPLFPKEIDHFFTKVPSVPFQTKAACMLMAINGNKNPKNRGYLPTKTMRDKYI